MLIGRTAELKRETAHSESEVATRTVERCCPEDGVCAIDVKLAMYLPRLITTGSQNVI